MTAGAGHRDGLPEALVPALGTDVRLADSTRLVVKRFTAGAGSTAARTAAALTLARDAGVPVPAVLGTASGADDVLVLEHLDGATWRDALPDLGAGDLAALHVLDWGRAWAGSAESDLARLAFWGGMTGPEFWIALDAPPLDEVAGRRRLVLQLLWALEHADRSPRHRADTAALQQRLGVG